MPSAIQLSDLDENGTIRIIDISDVSINVDSSGDFQEFTDNDDLVELDNSSVIVYKTSNSLTIKLPSSSDLLPPYNYISDGVNIGIVNLFQIIFASDLDESRFNSSKIANWIIGSFTIEAVLINSRSVIISSINRVPGIILLLEGQSYDLITGYSNLPDITAVSINLDNGLGGFLEFTESDDVIKLYKYHAGTLYKRLNQDKNVIFRDVIHSNIQVSLPRQPLRFYTDISSS